MYDHSYSSNTLNYVLRKGDFRTVPFASRETFRAATLNAAVKSALSIFNTANPISKFHLKKKLAYRAIKLEDDLVVRKLSLNLERITKKSPRGRSFLISNLLHFIEEGVPYRVYRLDVRSFYESFLIEDIKEKTLSLRKLNPLSKQLLEALLDNYATIGGLGLPRGMAISATLSDFMMSDFDYKIFANPAVYFYGRYVDDIIIITNLSEGENDFIDQVMQQLPQGLQLNNKKKSIHSVPEKTPTKKDLISEPIHNFSFDYLGYRFSIFAPKKNDKATEPGFRLIRVEIATNKLKKIKRRIVRSFIDFQKTNDASLLIDRIKYLTSNFSVVDQNTGKRKLAGIYHSYPALSIDSQSLAELDQFLRNAVLSKSGRVFSKTSLILASGLKRKLLAQSFRAGHTHQRFVYFSPAKINQIQECWINE